MLNPQDIINLSMVGTNGQTRKQATITGAFNGLGYRLDTKGQPASTTPELTGLPTGAGSKPPAFPTEQFNKALAQGLAGASEVDRITRAHREAYAAWKESAEGGDVAERIASAALEYLVQYHNFSVEVDAADKFVVKREDVEVTQSELPDGRTNWTVSGVAVFGAVSR